MSISLNFFLWPVFDYTDDDDDDDDDDDEQNNAEQEMIRKENGGKRNTCFSFGFFQFLFKLIMTNDTISFFLSNIIMYHKNK